uniref:DDE_Tnp_IS1595 domain-containing protein n=1 Tax=Caenorhabditis tropicalis TaxID=1561998 RepID=A0A1I7UW49_9PELO
MMNETALSNKSVADYRCFIRQLSMEISKKYPVIGGRGKSVQVDESALHTKKFGKGIKDTQVEWVFGGIETGTRKVFAVKVDDRRAPTLLKILQQRVHPESTIISDCFKSYTKLNQHFAGHSTVNHSTNFVDPTTGVHTNAIESYWSRMKRPFKLSHGIHADQVDMVIAESVVREWEGDDFLKKILQEVKAFRH